MKDAPVRYAFREADERIDRQARECLLRAARPPHLEGIDVRSLLEPEVQPYVVLRDVAPAAAALGGLHEVARRHLRARAEGTPIRAAAHEVDHDEVVLAAAVIAQKSRR